MTLKEKLAVLDMWTPELALDTEYQKQLQMVCGIEGRMVDIPDIMNVYQRLVHHTWLDIQDLMGHN